MTDQATTPESDIPGKPTSASRTTLSHIMGHNDTNLLGTVHGGVIMKLVDDAAGAVAGRHSGGPAVTASMDEMAFLEPVRVGDLVHVKAQVNWTGRTSMEVGVRVLAERWNESTPAQQVGTAYLVFPGALHTRFDHSIGSLHMAAQLSLMTIKKRYGADGSGGGRSTTRP